MIVSGLDFGILMQCIQTIECRRDTEFEGILLLKKKMLAARKVSPEEVPSDVVTMNSFVKLKQISTDSVFTVKLVYPDFENVNECRISIFSALGQAIFLRRKGDQVSYTAWGKENCIRIMNIIFQPEANGNYYARKYNWNWCHEMR